MSLREPSTRKREKEMENRNIGWTRVKKKKKKKKNSIPQLLNIEPALALPLFKVVGRPSTEYARAFYPKTLLGKRHKGRMVGLLPLKAYPWTKVPAQNSVGPYQTAK